MICTSCGRNNPPGQMNCIGCSASLIAPDPTSAMNAYSSGGYPSGAFPPPASTPSNTYPSGSFQAPPVNPYQTQAPYVAPNAYNPTRSYSGFATTSNKQMYLFGLIASILYALCAFMNFATVSLTYMGVSLYSKSVRLIQGAAGWEIVAVAALACVMSISGNKKGLIAAGGIAIGLMLYKVVTFDNTMRDVLKTGREELGEYSSVVKISITKDMGFWMLVFTAVILLAAGLIGLIQDKK